MKYEITHLKAPWPKGAKVGDVFEASDGPVPAWAFGKVKQAEDGAKTTLTLPKRKPTEGEDSDGPTEASTPVGQEQEAAETAEQRAQRERDEKAAAEALANGAPASATDEKPAKRKA